MFRSICQILAFFFPQPINVWLHRLGGAKIGKHTTIHPGVLILAKQVAVGSDTKIRTGTLIYARSFKVGRKCLLGYFILVKGISDLKIGDACVIGPRTTINCDCPVTLGYYSGIGPHCALFTHGSFLPLTEGYHASFGPIELKDKAWVTLGSTIGPGVTIGEGSIVSPGSVLLKSVPEGRMISGDQAKQVNTFVIKNSKSKDLAGLAGEILQKYGEWANEYQGMNWQMSDGSLQIDLKGRQFSIGLNGTADILLLTDKGQKSPGMYFNLADLTTDDSRHPAKMKFERYMRVYYGLTFL